MGIDKNKVNIVVAGVVDDGASASEAYREARAADG
jgi:hypothetical protein